MASRNYTNYYPHHTDQNSGDGSHIKLFNEITNILNGKEKEVSLPEHHVINIDKSSKKSIGKDDILNLDGVENLSYDYGVFNKKKKYLSGLIGIVTDFVSDNVYVEKILERLDIIVNDMNNDKQLIDMIFKDKLSENEYGTFGIIFKGGNVYKLFTQVLNKQLDTHVFQNYLSDTERFFKKSDCDFGLIFIKHSHTDPTFAKLIHLERSTENEKLISILQFMILNKYRNDFLNNENSFEYLSLCGKNDNIMVNRMNKMAKTMMELIISIKLEFEQTVLKYLINIIKFVSPSTGSDKSYVNKYLSKAYINDIMRSKKPNTYDTHTFLGIINNDEILKIYVNIEPQYGIINGNILDWYKLFLGYVFRDNNYFPKDEKFKNVKLPVNIIADLQALSTDKAEWRDIRTLYNIKNISNIIIGDNIYPIYYGDGQNITKDSNIYNSIISQTEYPDTVAEIAVKRYKVLNRMHSNRNDFTIKFEKSKSYNLSNNIKVVDDVMKIKTIPFEKNQLTQEEQAFITPFYISINKDISGKCTRLSSELQINNWLLNMERFFKYGSSGFTEKEHAYNLEYIAMYKDVNDNYDKILRSESKTLNFGLSRLLVSFNIIVETYDSKHYAFPLPAEYIDLSYSYNGDYKVFLYERYNGYLLFNGTINPPIIKTIANKYKFVIDYVNSDQYILDIISSSSNISKSDALIYQKRAYNALKEQDYNLLKSEPLIISKLSKIVDFLFKNLNTDLQSIFTKSTSNRISPLLKIIKYYTHYGSDFSQSESLSNKVIYFPKLSTFILDLYTILFADTLYPWIDAKYAKRLQRYIFFVFIERLQSTSIKEIWKLLDEMGIKIYKDNINRKDNYTDKLREFIVKLNENIKDYEYYNSISHTYNFVNDRNNYIIDDDSLLLSSDNIPISTCGIDKFMYSYHLLDFFDVYKNKNPSSNTYFIRSQYIVNKSNTYYIVSVTYEEATDINKFNQIIENIPKDDLGLENNNPIIKLPSDTDIKRYIKISQSSEDSIIRELYKYIIVITDIREKLLITIYNYIYNNYMNIDGKINMIKIDPNIMMLNIYEGDIDKILSVI